MSSHWTSTHSPAYALSAFFPVTMDGPSVLPAKAVSFLCALDPFPSYLFTAIEVTPLSSISLDHTRSVKAA